MDSTLQFELARAIEALQEAPNSSKVLTLTGLWRDGKYHLDCNTGLLITDWQLIDHGIDHEQYFPGYGLAFSDFTAVASGCGTCFADALDDALDSLAQQDFELDGLDEAIAREWGYDVNNPPISPDAHDDCHQDCDHEDGDDCKEHEECELYYYVSIKVKN